MHVDDQARRGTVKDIVVTGRMLMLPLIDEQDIWVSRKTDDRVLHPLNTGCSGDTRRSAGSQC